MANIGLEITDINSVDLLRVNASTPWIKWFGVHFQIGNNVRIGETFRKSHKFTYRFLSGTIVHFARRDKDATAEVLFQDGERRKIRLNQLNIVPMPFVQYDEVQEDNDNDKVKEDEEILNASTLEIDDEGHENDDLDDWFASLSINKKRGIKLAINEP
jgi:hypothetical protein